MPPLLILLVGILIVIGMIVTLRINAFLALITAAIVVSLLAPGDLAEKISRVAVAFGNTTGSIGIVIAMAAVIGSCMMASGAADRVVRWFLKLLGVERGATALSFSGFVLAIPVFFDTVFYLLIPLARSMYRRTEKHYLKYVMAIAAGAAITHTLVPPTPGPLIIAENLGVDLGLMIMIGALVALPSAFVGMRFCSWLDRRMPVPMRPIGDQPEPEPPADDDLPGLFVSLLPIVLPVLMISTNTIVQTIAAGSPDDPGLARTASWTALVGNPNLALIVAAAIALVVYVRQRRPDRDTVSRLVESALMSGGIIILITAAGGAFGAMLQAAEIGPAIQGLFAGDTQMTGILMLLLGFFIASLLKFAQGSSTVAMITASAMLATMVTPEVLGVPMVYLATAIGSGSLVGSWMNDSGFWIFAKMSGLTEVESLKSWTPLLVVLGVTGLLISLLLALVLPLPS